MWSKIYIWIYKELRNILWPIEWPFISGLSGTLVDCFWCFGQFLSVLHFQDRLIWLRDNILYDRNKASIYENVLSSYFSLWSRLYAEFGGDLERSGNTGCIINRSAEYMTALQLWDVLNAEAGAANLGWNSFGTLEVPAAGRLGACEQGWLGKKAGSGWNKLGKQRKQNRTWSWVMQAYVLEL